MTPEALEARRLGLGGTDIAAILGLNPYHSPMGVYLEKLNLVEPQPDRMTMKIGRYLEPVLHRLYCEEVNLDEGWLREIPPIIHPLEPWRRGSPDRICPGLSRGVEFKTAGIRQAKFWGDVESDEVPEPYLVQCAWYMSLTGYAHWDVAALLGGQDFRVYHLHRDLELEAMMLEAGRKFWFEHIIAQVPPPLDSTRATDAYLLSRFPTHSETMLAMTDAHVHLAYAYVQAKRMMETYEIQKDTLAAQLKEAIGEFAGMQGDGVKITWKKTRDGSCTDWNAVAKAMNAPNDIIVAHTIQKPGVRRFLATIKEE